MINWITENIGTSTFENIKEIKDIHIIDVRDLIDRKGNMDNVLREKIKEGITYLEKGEKIIIACDYGISRSNSIAAAIIAKLKELSFADAVRMVMKKTGKKRLNLSVVSDIHKILDEKMVIEKKKFETSKNILITGSSGFIGSSLGEFIQDHLQIFTPKHKEIDLLEDLIELDLYIKENNIDTIIHLANPKIFITNQAMGDSLVMLKNILDACTENDVKLIYPSGWVIYSAYRSNSLLASEHLPPNPKESYGISKSINEIIIQHYGTKKGLNYLVLRFSPIYGGGNKPKFIYNFIEKALNGEQIISHRYLNGYPKLDLLHINDVTNLFKKILSSNLQGFFNIGTGVGISTTKVAQIIIEILNSSSNITHHQINDYTSNIVMDIRKIKSLIEWSPKIMIQDGLKLLINNLKKNLIKI